MTRAPITTAEVYTSMFKHFLVVVPVLVLAACASGQAVKQNVSPKNTTTRDVPWVIALAALPSTDPNRQCISGSLQTALALLLSLIHI